MLAETELLVLPYGAKDGKTILDLLLREFRSGEWTGFRGAVAFARSSGNYPDLLDAMAEFASSGGSISLTFGADVFGKDTRGSDYDAIAELLSGLQQYPSVSLYLYHEKNRTFHPKIYLFTNEEAERALLVVGSSNWSRGGLVENVEANVILRLDLSQADHREAYEQVLALFDSFWTEGT